MRFTYRFIVIEVLHKRESVRVLYLPDDPALTPKVVSVPVPERSVAAVRSAVQLFAPTAQWVGDMATARPTIRGLEGRGVAVPPEVVAARAPAGLAATELPTVVVKQHEVALK